MRNEPSDPQLGVLPMAISHARAFLVIKDTGYCAVYDNNDDSNNGNDNNNNINNNNNPLSNSCSSRKIWSSHNSS